MTKYILHGGETGIPNEHNAAFYQEWIKGLADEFVPTILLVYFSRPSEDWEILKEQDKARLAKYTNNRRVNFVLANANMSQFIEQVKNADVIYFRGGATEALMKIIFPIKDKLLEILDNKIYAGSSAGVMMLSHYMRSDTSSWKNGFGLLPINCFVHYSEKWKGDLDNFEKNNLENNFEYLLLPETEFVIREY